MTAPIATPSSDLFTEKQGQYLAFIYTYALINRRPPAEAGEGRRLEQELQHDVVPSQSMLPMLDPSLRMVPSLSIRPTLEPFLRTVPSLSIRPTLEPLMRMVPSSSMRAQLDPSLRTSTSANAVPATVKTTNAVSSADSLRMIPPKFGS